MCISKLSNMNGLNIGDNFNMRNDPSHNNIDEQSWKYYRQPTTSI